MKINLGVLASRIRLEEKLLIKEARKRSEVNLSVIDPRKITWEDSELEELDVLLDREISQSRAYHIMELMSGTSVTLVNDFETVQLCGDKAFTSVKLKKHGIPTPDFRVAFDSKSALQAVEDIGYPAVLKPVDGSWGRMVSKVDNRESAEATIEHKSNLDSHYHSIYYVQEFIDTGKKDIRAFALGEEVVGAAYRESDHWITNAARGGESSPYPVSDELVDIVSATSKVFGGGALAVDLLESDRGLLVNEINCSMEFKESMKAIEGDIPARLLDYTLNQAEASEEVTEDKCLV
ncbi:MAG: lysine biosynthesis protein LysX [Candidatus Bipolaricaulota bacterium]|nr:lysine biosynthesis protein LysX [Candidatus Bipolaricaulota bacterium]MBS3792445.1 lysine biosynthesis protein LysX [Candidatus Bipolaricaulota bacterium]